VDDSSTADGGVRKSLFLRSQVHKITNSQTVTSPASMGVFGLRCRDKLAAGRQELMESAQVRAAWRLGSADRNAGGDEARQS
jgi:hypothetical protein